VRFTIVGSGAIGGLIGAHLVRVQHDVLFCDSDVDHVAAMNRDGLRLEGPVANFTVPARAVLPVDLPEDLGIVLLAVKAQHTSAAAAPLAGRLGLRGYVVTVQNGLTGAAVAACVGADRVVQASINIGADLLAPGVILQGNVAAFHVGEPAGPISARVRELAHVLPWAEATDDIAGYLWGKQAYGAMLCATAVSDLSIADALGDPAYRALFLALGREVLAQAPVAAKAFDGFDPADLDGSLDRLVTLNQASAKSHSGIYRDLAVRHRPTEVGAILGELTEPMTTRVAELISAIERGERRCERANLDLLAAYEVSERVGRPLRAATATRRTWPARCGRPTRRWSPGCGKPAPTSLPWPACWSTPPVRPTPRSARR